MLLHEELARRGLKLILASQSPRRRDLMRDCGLEFRAVSYDIEELYPEDLAVDDVAEYLSQLKSTGYPELLQDDEVLITADTVVLHSGHVLGKPKDAEGARTMLRTLSESDHRVVSGVTLRSTRGQHSFSSITTVRFAELSEDQINYYVDRYSPLDKAGSYGIQEWIGYIGIESIEGSFYNVMGLPIQRLHSELLSFVTR